MPESTSKGAKLAAEALPQGLVERATGGYFPGDDDYMAKTVRHAQPHFLNPEIKAKLHASSLLNELQRGEIPSSEGNLGLLEALAEKEINEEQANPSKGWALDPYRNQYEKLSVLRSIANWAKGKKNGVWQELAEKNRK